METLRALVTTGLVFDRLSTSWVQTRNAVVLATASAAAVHGTEHDGPLSALAQHCSLLSVPSPSYADVAALFKVRVASWLDSWLVATTATTAAMTDVVDLEDEFHISTSLFQSTLAPVVKLVAAANAFRRGTSVSTATTPLAAASLAASVANRISTDGSDGGRHALSFTTGLRTISGTGPLPALVLPIRVGQSGHTTGLDASKSRGLHLTGPSTFTTVTCQCRGVCPS